MTTRFWPLESGRIVTSPFGKRGTEWHAGTDFGFPGGSGGRKVFSVSEGRVLYAGAAVLLVVVRAIATLTDEDLPDL